MGLSKSVIDARVRVLAIIRHPKYPNNSVNSRTVEVIKGIINNVVQECSTDIIGEIVDSPEELTRLNNLIGLSLEYDFNTGDLEEPCEDDPELRIARKYISLKERSVSKNMKFDLTLADIRKMYNRKRCQITGEKISLSEDASDPYRLSFERLDNSIGYTKANTVIVARWVNTLKNELFENDGSKFNLDKRTLASMIKMLQFYKDRL